MGEEGEEVESGGEASGWVTGRERVLTERIDACRTDRREKSRGEFPPCDNEQESVPSERKKERRREKERDGPIKANLKVDETVGKLGRTLDLPVGELAYSSGNVSLEARRKKNG
jgi:hypothetical protein